MLGMMKNYDNKSHNIVEVILLALLDIISMLSLSIVIGNIIFTIKNGYFDKNISLYKTILTGIIFILTIGVFWFSFLRLKHLYNRKINHKIKTINNF